MAQPPGWSFVVGTRRGIGAAATLALLVLFALSADSSLGQTGDQSLTLSTNAVAPQRFVAVHGRRAIIDGYADELEIWTYPFQILRNYQVAFRARGTTTSISGRDILSRIDYEPDSVTRVYLGPDFVVREKLFVPLNEPAAILSYEVQSKTPIDILVHAVPVLDLMWPASLGGQSVSWNSSLSAFVLAAPADGFTATVGSPDMVAHDEIVNRATHSEGVELAFTLRSSDTDVATLYVALNPRHASDPGAILHRLLSDRKTFEAETTQHFREFRESVLKIVTPDDEVNRAIAWSEIALDQAWVCNADLGCGYIAGYGPSRGARRPQYDWFFAGDGMIAADAAVSAGDIAHGRNELEFVLRYQDRKTGMIWHELSQSAGMIDWQGKYPYMFVHVDITFQFLNSLGHYVTASGDIQFVRDHWSAIENAYRYCASLIDATTSLPRIPADKEGGNEQQRMSDDLGLSLSWVEASSAFAQMAKLTNQVGLAEQASRAGERARGAIEHHYWDAKNSFWVNGHTAAGQPMTERRSGPAEAISMHLFNRGQTAQILDQLASTSFQTDWGTRGVGADSTGFDPESYASGSVWPVHTAALAGAFWSEHRPITALSLWESLLPLISLGSLGHIPEVLAGNVYRPQAESVPEQTWSSAGFVDSTVHGLLGLQMDSLANKLEFAPRLPADWSDLSVSHIRLGSRLIALRLQHIADDITLQIDNPGDSFSFEFAPELPLGAKLRHATFNHHLIAATVDGDGQETVAKVAVNVPRGTTELQLAFKGGISVVVDATPPMLGDSSAGMRVVKVRLEGSVLTIDADVRADRSSTLQLLSLWKVTGASGAMMRRIAPDRTELTFEAIPGALAGYRHVNATVELAP